MFGFPSMYEPPRRSAPSYDPFGFGGYSRPTHRPQPHTSFRNPYGYQYDPRYYNTEDDESSEEEEEYYPQQQRVAPQQQVRLDNHQQLTPQQRMYLQQKQRQQQQQQQQQQQYQHQHQKQHKQHKHAKQSSQHQPSHQTHHVPVQQKKIVDQDKEALKIQRSWRGYQVRKHDIISKLRSIHNIEGEVDAITSTPINQRILNLNPAGPLPSDLDTYHVGNIPRNVMMLEHELTAKLLSLDGISGASEIIRPRRKGLVNKIEGILSKVDAIKKVYASMTPPPNPTPSITTPEDTTPSSSSSSSSSSTPAKKKEIEESVNQQAGGSVISEPSSTTTIKREEQQQQTTHDLSEQLDSLDIQDVSDEPTLTPGAPSISSTPSTSSSSTVSYSPSQTKEIPSLKNMCFSLCDSLIKRGLVVN